MALLTSFPSAGSNNGENSGTGTKVKGNNEEKFREGEVILSPEDFKLGDTFAVAIQRANILPDDNLSVAFGKLAKYCSDLESGAGSTLLGENLQATRALVSDVNGKVGVSTVTAAELQHLAGMDGNIKAKLDELSRGNEEVYIGDTEPTDEKPLWINPDEDHDDISAASVSYDGSKSGLKSSNLQDAVSELTDNMYYKPGDEISIQGYCTAGFLTSSRTLASFSIPLCKPVKNIKSVAINFKMAVRQNNNYILGSGSSAEAPTSITYTLRDGFIVISATIPASDNSINNSAIGIAINTGTIVFS